MAFGPFDLSGGPFLILYAALFVCCHLASRWIEHRLRPDGLTPLRLPAEDAALLAGGAPRYTEAVMAELLATGQVRLEGERDFTLAAIRPGGPARALAVLPRPFGWRPAERALAPLARAAQERLVRSGLLLGQGAAMQVRLGLALPYVLLVGFGLIKLGVGEARGRPVGFLTLLLIVTMVVAVVRFAGFDARTRAGQAALAQACARHARLRRAPALDEAGLGVALFGTTVLIGSGWEVLHRLRTAGGDGAVLADGGSSDGGGSGGCGGGGCGGCSS
jgi:uncharacterized protein (TIGR04222 family)